ncbi:MAG TPA: hypothetical protein VK256_09225 [Candidatus Eisenbacteria bacterium]|nr:hypothetical protein [Candidatus Eisenbacteria bacterium]
MGSDALAESLRQVEAIICGLTFEVAVGIDPSGAILFWRTGDDYSVGPTEEEWALVCDKILTHNHPPGGGSLQTEDLFRAKDHFLREVRAVTSDWIFIMRRPPTGWVTDDRIMDLTEATEGPIHSGVNWEERPEWSRLFWHEMWLRIAPQIGYQYSWAPMWDVVEPAPLPTKPGLWPASTEYISPHDKRLRGGRE